jgi:hypothetical protein
MTIVLMDFEEKEAAANSTATADSSAALRNDKQREQATAKTTAGPSTTLRMTRFWVGGLVVGEGWLGEDGQGYCVGGGGVVAEFQVEAGFGGAG